MKICDIMSKVQFHFCPIFFFLLFQIIFWTPKGLGHTK